jgi:hypothetical protein
VTIDHRVQEAGRGPAFWFLDGVFIANRIVDFRLLIAD